MHSLIKRNHEYYLFSAFSAFPQNPTLITSVQGIKLNSGEKKNTKTYENEILYKRGSNLLNGSRFM